ncbi:hypothetical protein ACIPVK_20150 [Paeniglutamicibacter sp. MACA_103]|uniref:hypothetical protein n=1 Tax=Paeniglutamicibacter sp. MACA_103 TaxID=3377337 RepID=UPI0038946F93
MVLVVPRKSSNQVDKVGLVMALICVVAGSVIPVRWWEANVSVVLMFGLIAFIFGFFIFMFSRGLVGVIAFFVILFAGTIWLESTQGFQGTRGEASLTWSLLAIAGSIVGGNLRPDLKRTAVLRKSGVLVVQWKDGHKLAEDAAASAESLEERVRALDGKKRALVSAMRGSARMDFCGDADGAMVAYFSPDTSDDRLWSMMTTPGADLGQIEVVIGDLEGAFENWETTSMEPAVAAARHFASTGQADPGLTWYASTDVCERRPLAS